MPPTRFRPLPLTVVLLLCGGLAALADEPRLLAYKFNKGDVARYRTRVELKQVQSFADQKIEITLASDSRGTRTVEQIDGDGRTHFKTRTDAMQVAAKIPGLDDYTFDSKSTTRDKSSETGGALTPIFERLIGSEFDLFVAARGEVKEVKNYGEMLAELLKDNTLGVQVTRGGSNGAAHIALQEALVVLSDKPVKPGDTWECAIDVELPNLGRIKGPIKYQYAAPDKVGDLTTARIEWTNETAFEVNVEISGVKAAGVLSPTSSSGVAQFDPAAGRLVSLKSSQTVAGQLILDGLVPFQSEQTQTITSDLLAPNAE